MSWMVTMKTIALSKDHRAPADLYVQPFLELRWIPSTFDFYHLQDLPDVPQIIICEVDQFQSFIDMLDRRRSGYWDHWSMLSIALAGTPRKCHLARRTAFARGNLLNLLHHL